jgi:excisionase family DNA binding protein
VADLLGCSRSTVYRLIDRGELPAVKIGGLVRFKRESVEELIQRGSAV